MSKLLECKVCGKMYEGCRSKTTPGVLRWQNVACCPEHGSIYFERILESRRPKEVDPVEIDVMIPSADPDFSEDLLGDDESLDEYDEEYEELDDEEEWDN